MDLPNEDSCIPKPYKRHVPYYLCPSHTKGISSSTSSLEVSNGCAASLEAMGNDSGIDVEPNLDAVVEAFFRRYPRRLLLIIDPRTAC